MGAHHHVCIIHKTFFLEIQIYSKSGDDCSGYLHHKVYKSIKQSLEKVCKETLKLPDDYRYGFSCCCNNESKQHVHLMIIENPDEELTQAYCSKSHTLHQLTEGHTVWFSEVHNGVYVAS